MKEDNLEISKEELRKVYNVQKMIYETEEKFLLKKKKALIKKPSSFLIC